MRAGGPPALAARGSRLPIAQGRAGLAAPDTPCREIFARRQAAPGAALPPAFSQDLHECKRARPASAPATGIVNVDCNMETAPRTSPAEPVPASDRSGAGAALDKDISRQQNAVAVEGDGARGQGRHQSGQGLPRWCQHWRQCRRCLANHRPGAGPPEIGATMCASIRPGVCASGRVAPVASNPQRR